MLYNLLFTFSSFGVANYSLQFSLRLIPIILLPFYLLLMGSILFVGKMLCRLMLVRNYWDVLLLLFLLILLRNKSVVLLVLDGILVLRSAGIDGQMIRFY